MSIGPLVARVNRLCPLKDPKNGRSLSALVWWLCVGGGGPIVGRLPNARVLCALLSTAPVLCFILRCGFYAADRWRDSTRCRQSLSRLCSFLVSARSRTLRVRFFARRFHPIARHNTVMARHLIHSRHIRYCNTCTTDRHWPTWFNLNHLLL